jgi:hypothetical protein
MSLSDASSVIVTGVLILVLIILSNATGGLFIIIVNLANTCIR